MAPYAPTMASSAPLLQPQRRSKSSILTEEVEVSPISNDSPHSQVGTTTKGTETSHTTVHEFHGRHQLSMSIVTTIIDDDDDDDSLALFEESDFSRDTWGNVIYEKMTDAPRTIGVAVVVAFALFHPLVFLAGAATAVGAVHMIGQGYDFISESKVFCCETATTQVVVAAEKKQQQLGEARADSSVPSTVLAQNPTFETLKSDDDEHEFLETSRGDWLPRHFPSLREQVTHHDVEFDGLNALEFFHVFFGDEAPYTFKEFQKQRGDIDIEYGSWKRVVPSPTPLSLHPEALSCDTTLYNLDCYERSLSFKTETKSYFGPPYAQAVKTQRVHLHKRLMIMESRTELENIPFCDRFFLIERWVLNAPKTTSGSKKLATLSVHAQVFFTKQCAFEQQILAKSSTTLAEVVTSWCEMATQALEITMQHKLERERREQQEAVEDCVEVEQDSEGKALVLCDATPFFPPMMVVSAPPRPPSNRSLKSLKRSVVQRMIRKSSSSIQ